MSRGRGRPFYALQPVVEVPTVGLGLLPEVWEPWRDQALCAQTDPEVFYPDKGGSTKEGKKVCLGCEARLECLQYALDHQERYGIWGGLSERERRKLLRRRHERGAA